MTITKRVKWVVNSGYAGAFPYTFDNAKDARERYRKERDVPSYLNPKVKQPAELVRVTTIIQTLASNRK